MGWVALLIALGLIILPFTQSIAVFILFVAALISIRINVIRNLKTNGSYDLRPNSFYR